jgi:glycosyltransferase 2 family protein
VRKTLKYCGPPALALVLIWWFAKDLEWAQVLGSVRDANWPLLVAATALILTTYFVRALRWQCLLAPVSPGVKLSNLFAATALGFTAVLFVGRTGEIVRPVALSSKERVRPSAAFATIMIERIFDAVTVVAIFSANLLFFDTPLAGGMPMGRIRLAGGILLGASALGIFGLVMLRRHRVGAVDFLQRRLGFLGRRLRRMVVNFVSNFAESLSVLHDFRELVIASAYSLLLWGICIASNLLTMRAFGLENGVSDSIFVLGFSMIGSLVPTPGGAAGAFHAATQNGLLLLGIERNAAAAISIVMHLLAFGSAAVFGIYYILRGGISLTRLRAALHEDLNSQGDFLPGVEPADRSVTVTI